MWFRSLRRSLTGSALSLKEREVLALEEHNALLRAQLELHGAKVPRKILEPHPRLRTEADITRQTRASILAHQQQKREASRPWSESLNGADPEAPTKKPASTPPPTDVLPEIIS